MYCPKCGTQNDDNAFKCTKCGIIIQQVPLTTVPAKKSNTVVFVVIGIAIGLFILIGIIAAIAIPAFVGFQTRSRDVLAYTSLKTACYTASSFFIEDPYKTLTIDDLKGRGVNMPPEIELSIENGTMSNLMMRAKHNKGTKIYVADSGCNIREKQP